MGYLRAGPSQVSIVKTLTGAATLALLGVLAFGVSVADATHNMAHNAGANAVIAEGADDSYGAAICMVTGAAGTAASPVDSFARDQATNDTAVNPAAPLNDTDGGTFDFFSTTVACAGEDEGGEVIGAVAGDDFRIYAGEGSRVQESEYTNLVCGTGHAEGTADLYRGPDGAETTNLKTSFSISFVNAIGPLAITGFEGIVGLDVPVGAGSQDVDTGHGVGVVQILPDEPSEAPEPGDTGTTPCVDRGVSGFFVSSAFEATLSGDETNANYDENEDVPAT